MIDFGQSVDDGHYEWQYQNYGLRRAHYRANRSDANMASVVALACEGAVWQRLWSVGIDNTGKLVEVRTPHVPPPVGAWLGDYHVGAFGNNGALGNEAMNRMVAQLRILSSDNPGAVYTVDEHGDVQTLH